MTVVVKSECNYKLTNAGMKIGPRLPSATGPSERDGDDCPISSCIEIQVPPTELMYLISSLPGLPSKRRQNIGKESAETLTSLQRLERNRNEDETAHTLSWRPTSLKRRQRSAVGRPWFVLRIMFVKLMYRHTEVKPGRVRRNLTNTGQCLGTAEKQAKVKRP